MKDFEQSPPDRVDLSGLDPDTDAAAAERFVSNVLQRVAVRDRYPVTADPLVGVWSLALPMGLAAALAVVATLALEPRPAAISGVPQTVAEAVGVPPEFIRTAGPLPDARGMKP